MDPQELEKKKKEGWIHTHMMVEVMAVSEEAAKSALEQHIANLEREKRTLFVKKEFHEIKKVESPNPEIKEAFSNIVSLEILTEDYDTLIYLVMNYGPAATEILHPEKIILDTGEAQGILNSIADIIHKFAQQGLGGIIIKS